MEIHGIRAKDLAKEMGVSPNAISNMRSADMPKINGERMNSLIISLNRLRKAKEQIISPHDLLVFSLSPDEMKVIGL